MLVVTDQVQRNAVGRPRHTRLRPSGRICGAAALWRPEDGEKKSAKRTAERVSWMRRPLAAGASTAPVRAPMLAAFFKNIIKMGNNWVGDREQLRDNGRPISRTHETGRRIGNPEKIPATRQTRLCWIDARCRSVGTACRHEARFHGEVAKVSIRAILAAHPATSNERSCALSCARDFFKLILGHPDRAR